MRLRYYADAEVQEWHDYTLQLLSEIHDQHGITVEIDRINERFGPITSFPGPVRQATSQEVYDRDLKRNRTLTERIDQRPSEAFKHYGDLDIAGNVALVDSEGTVTWASTLPGFADGYGPSVGPDASIDFLDDIVDGPSNRFCVDCLGPLDGDEQFCPHCGAGL